MDRLWQAKPVSGANRKVMAELQRERANPDEHPSYLHQDKNTPQTERIEDAEKGSDSSSV